MDTQTEPGKPNTLACARILRVIDDKDLHLEHELPLLLRQKLNQYRRAVVVCPNPDEVARLYRKWMSEPKHDLRLDVIENAIDFHIKTVLRRGGVEVDDMDFETLYVTFKEFVTERDGKYLKDQKRRAEDSRRAMIENAFRCTQCPERHVLNLDIIDAEQHPKWTQTRDLLLAQTQFANGYLVALLGGRGTGKTQLAVSLIHKATPLGVPARYVKVIDLFRDIRRAFAPKSEESESKIISHWAEHELLVIDEIHQRGETSWEDNLLTNLIDARYDKRKCTLLIGNLTKLTFATAMGDSIVSRLHETGQVITADWESFRKPGKWTQADDAPRRRGTKGNEIWID